MIGCCAHLTTAWTRGLLIFTLATTALGERWSMLTALCSQLCRLADAHRWQGQAN